MNRTVLNYALTLAMGLLGVVLAISSLLLWVVFPSGYYPSRLLWIEIHKWVGLALTILVIVHLLSHWRWIKRMTLQYLQSFRRHARTPSRSRLEETEKSHHNNRR